MITFKYMDLRQDRRGQGPFDLVLCRIVLNYFDVETKKAILHQIHRVLQPTRQPYVVSGYRERIGI